MFVFQGGKKSKPKKDGKRKRDKSDDETPVSLVLTEKTFDRTALLSHAQVNNTMILICYIAIVRILLMMLMVTKGKGPRNLVMR